jgi:NitT/TauT family transport system permease protein
MLALDAAIERGVISSFLLPRPSAVVASFPMLIFEERLLARFATTGAEICAATIMATVVGGAAGLALHRSERARLAYTSWVVALNTAPTILLYPLFLVILGRSIATIVALGFISALPPIILKTREGLDGTRKVLLDVGRSFGLTHGQRLKLIQVPSAVPTLFTGVRLGLVYATTTVVGTELLASIGGLGQLIPELADRYEIPALYGAIVFIILASASLHYAVARFEKWLRPA